MSGYGPNPILSNKKKNNFGRPEHLLPHHHHLTSDNFSFILPYPLHPPPLQSGRHTCITPNGVLFT